MKAVKIILTFILSVIMIGLLCAQDYKVDINQSTLKWTGKKIGGSHNGHIKIMSGELSINNKMVTKGMFVIDMKTIANDDLKNEALNKKLVDHLKSDDFFGVEKHPKAKLEIMSSTPMQKDMTEIMANLTIKGITHPISFKGKKNGNILTAMIVVDRAKYDVRYGSGSFFDNLGDKLIYDDFTLEVRLIVEEKDK
jgi:polyisoprenoid-binding protein YceI